MQPKSAMLRPISILSERLSCLDGRLKKVVVSIASLLYLDVRFGRLHGSFNSAGEAHEAQHFRRTTCARRVRIIGRVFSIATVAAAGCTSAAIVSRAGTQHADTSRASVGFIDSGSSPEFVCTTRI